LAIALPAVSTFETAETISLEFNKKDLHQKVKDEFRFSYIYIFIYLFTGILNLFKEAFCKFGPVYNRE
jgi:hypothetical protein